MGEDVGIAVIPYFHKNKVDNKPTNQTIAAPPVTILKFANNRLELATPADLAAFARND